MRHTTGIAGLDEIVQGGLWSGSVYIIRGTPGAGKTIFANQICHHWANKQERCLYITLLSESHDRLIENLQNLAFFSPQSLSRIHYQSGFHTLENEGLTGILRLLIEETKRYQSCLIVLDGLFVLQEQVNSERDFRLFMNQLQNLAHVAGSTMLLLTNSDRGTGSPEYTMVDGWLELAVQPLDYRVSRYLQVHKLRGSGFIDGQHALSITDAGVQVFPRLERAAGQHPASISSPEKLPTGIAGLDEMFDGGLRKGSSTLLVGATGVGKTAFGLHFLSLASAAEPGLFFGFYEGRDDLIEKARVLGICDLEQALDAGTVTFIWHPPSEHLLDELAYKLARAVRETGAKRLFLDGIDALRQASLHPDRMSRFISALNNLLRNEGVTSLFTLETPELIGGEARVQFTSVSAIAQNIVLLRYAELDSQIFRTLSIIKARTSQFDNRIRKFEITESGVRLAGPFHRAGDLLTGHAHHHPQEDTGANE